MHHYSMLDYYDSTFHLTHLPNNWIKLNAHREFKGQLDLFKLGRFWKFSSKHWAHRLSSVCTDLKFSRQLLSMHEVSFSVEPTYHTDHISLWNVNATLEIHFNLKKGVFVCILLSSGEFCHFHDLIQTHSKNGWRWSNLFGKRLTKCKCWKFYRLR